jgi:WD40 repeat protein/serine/threonine protein kinase
MMKEEELRFRWAQTVVGQNLDSADPSLTYKTDTESTKTVLLHDLARATFSAQGTIDSSAPVRELQKPSILPSEDVGSDGSSRSAPGASFDVIEELGRGGMGVVYRARQRSLDRDIAIKKIIPGRSNDTVKQKFVAEARVTGQLDHPNIVPVHELAENEQGEVLLAMKLVEGLEWLQLLHPKTAEEKEKSEKYELEDHLNILDDVCNAIKFAHDKKICHLDLKPENVMIGEYGEVLVMDWGISVSYESPDKLEDSTLLHSLHRSGIRGPRGTPAYMAPELAEGEGSEIDNRTDIYLLGAILHEILTARPPHVSADKSKRETLTQVLLRACESEPPQFDKSIPEELQDICRKALAQKPEERYQCVADLQQEMKLFLRHKESTAISDKAQRTLIQCQSTFRSSATLSSAEQNQMYGDFALAVAGFGQATFLWAGNPEALEGQNTARLSYARAALEGGDLGLAEAQLSKIAAQQPEKGQLLGAVAEQKQTRQRAKATARKTRQGLVAAALIIIVGLGIGVTLIEAERQVAIAAGEAEKEERKKAQLAEKSARDSAVKALQAEKKARDEEQRAKNSEEQARQSESKAVLAEKKARAKELVAKAAQQAEQKQREKAELLIKEGYLERAVIALQSKDVSAAWVLAEKAVCPELAGQLRTLWLKLKECVGRPLWTRHIAREDKVTSVALSPDGQSLAVTQMKGRYKSTSGVVPIEQFSISGERLSSYYGHKEGIRDAAYHPNGKLIASVGTDLFVHFWNPENGQLIVKWKAHEKEINRLCFSADGKYLATAGGDKEVLVWSVKTRTLFKRFRGHVSDIWCLAFDKKGRYLVSTGGRFVRFWSLDGDIPVPKTIELKSSISALTLSPKNDCIILGVNDATIQIWDLQTHRRRLLIRGHRSAVWWVAMHPGEEIFASCGSDETICLWDIATGQLRRRFRSHRGSVARVVFSGGKGQKLLSCGYDKTVRLWDIRSYKKENKIKLGLGASSVDFSMHPEKRLAVVSENKNSKGQTLTRIWDWEKKIPLKTLPVNQYIHSLIYSHSGRFIAGNAFWNGQFYLWDAESGQILIEHEKGQAQAENASFSPDDRLVALQYNDRKIRIWDTQSRKLQKVLTVRRGGAAEQVERELTPGWSWGASTSFSADGQWLATAGAMNNIIVWDVKTGRELYDLSGHSDGLIELQFHPKNKTVLGSVAYDKTIRLWDLSKSQRPQRTISLPLWAYDLKFNGSGSMFVARYDQTVGLWSTKTGQSLLSLDYPKPLGDVRLANDESVLLVGQGPDLHLESLALLKEPLESLFRDSEGRTGFYVKGTKVESFCRYCVSGLRQGACSRCRGIGGASPNGSTMSRLNTSWGIAQRHLTLGQQRVKSKAFKEAMKDLQKSLAAWEECLVLAEALGIKNRVDRSLAMARDCVRYLSECHAGLTMGPAALKEMRRKKLDLDLAEAAAMGQMGEVQRLLKLGASIDGRSKFGSSALMLAVRNGRYELVRYFLNRGARLDLKNKSGDGLVASAVESRDSNSSFIFILKAAGAKIDTREKGGDTPLMRAAQFNRRWRLKALLYCGADPSLKDKNGDTARALAVKKGFKEIVEIIDLYSSLKAGDAKAQLVFGDHLIRVRESRDRLLLSIANEGLELLRKASVAGHLQAQEQLSLALSTHYDSRFRNGKEALKWGLDLCEKTKDKSPKYFDAVASAYAELGDFQNAMKWAERALKEGKGQLSGAQLMEVRQRLSLFKMKRPYRGQWQ